MPWSSVKPVQVVALRRWSKAKDIHRPHSVEMDMECKSDCQFGFISLSIAIESIMGQDYNHLSTRQIPCKR